MKRIASLALLTLLSAIPASAAVYTYTEATSTNTQWSLGTSWSATPASAADTVLVFTNSVALEAGTSIVSDNDISGNFLLNRMLFAYPGPASGAVPMLNLTGNPLEFTGASATLTLSSAGTVKPSLTVSNQIVLSTNLTVYASATITTNITFAGKITGSSGLTFDGVANTSQTLVLTNALNDYAGNTRVVHSGTTGGIRTLRAGTSEVIPHGEGKGNLILSSTSSGAKVARMELYGNNETINGLVADSIQKADDTQSLQNGAATDATLTIGANGASASFMGRLANGGTGKLNIVKIGTGTQTLAGIGTYTGSTTVSNGMLIVDFNKFSTLIASNPSNYFATGSALVLNGTTFAIQGRTDGGAIEQTGVAFGQYTEAVTLSNANASQLVVGQAVTLTKTSGGGTPPTGMFVTGKATPGASTTVVYLPARAGGGGNGTGTVTSAPTVGTTSQTVKSLTLSGVAGSNATIDFGTSDTVVLTINAAPVQTNDGSTLTIANWSGDMENGGAAERLMFVGEPADFTAVFGQGEILFDGFGSGYKLIDGAGVYEVVPKPTSPTTLLIIR